MGLFGGSKAKMEREALKRKAEAWGIRVETIHTLQNYEFCIAHPDRRDESVWSTHDFANMIVKYEKAVKNPGFGELVIRLLEDEFLEPYWIFDYIGVLSPQQKEEAKQLILEMAKTADRSRWHTIDGICKQNDWLDDLEQLGRALDYYDDVLSILARQKKWDECAAWCRDHNKFEQCLVYMERANRFEEAITLIEKIGWANVFPDEDIAEAKGECDRWIARLRGLANLNGSAEGQTLSFSELESKYAYGEISKEEYQALKLQLTPSPNSCSSCAKPLQRGFTFCPHCGRRQEDSEGPERPLSPFGASTRSPSEELF